MPTYFSHDGIIIDDWMNRVYGHPDITYDPHSQHYFWMTTREVTKEDRIGRFRVYEHRWSAKASTYEEIIKQIEKKIEQADAWEARLKEF